MDGAKPERGAQPNSGLEPARRGRAYSRTQARKLFEMFSDVKIEVEQMTRADLRFLSALVSNKLFYRLSRSIGWNVIITATK